MNPQSKLPYWLLLGLALTSWACQQDTPPAASATPDLRLVKQLTDRYYGPIPFQLPASSFQTITYQNIPFYYSPLTSQSQDVYQYDDQRRLIRTDANTPNSPQDTYTYFGQATYGYQDNQLIYTNLRSLPLTPTAYALTDQGYVAPNSVYDPDGYLLSRQEGAGGQTTQRIVEGNIVQRVYETSAFRQTITYEYDLTRPGLPNPTVAQAGRSSRNLVVKTTDEYAYASQVPSIVANRVVTIYTYEFDAQGVVKRQFAFSESNRQPDPTVLGRELRISEFTFSH